jgi:uncharacterized membrane protein
MRCGIRLFLTNRIKLIVIFREAGNKILRVKGLLNNFFVIIKFLSLVLLKLVLHEVCEEPSPSKDLFAVSAFMIILISMGLHMFI